ncbi:pseudoazurin [Notoacmeibacter ruber]|uniref:Pseudoazurin n=1 Tax=Notoacmeibacter ruber TaxID=2670375 RepID=A0A3L7JBR4_9HYPH|nr:pseudoazurin [Notoacmeibacter ruber]RLQ87920.1 pseudoazurin [Notoacmeibacter ruber]
MFARISAALAIATVLSGSAWAETFEVQMLNRGEEGTMVFEPSFIQIAPGDTVKFIATDKSHNAQSVDEMIPEGAEPFVGKINQEVDITPEVPGVYVVKCNPHFAMGMVMTIAVGEEAQAPEGFLEHRLPRNAKKRLEEQLSNL